MNSVTGVSWLWRALRGRSVTFAVLFACGILGVSVVGEFRHLLSRLGAPWYAWILVPMIAVAVIARKEAEWLPEEEKRQKWSRWVVIGAIVLSVLISRLHHEKPQERPHRPAPESHGRPAVPGL